MLIDPKHWIETLKVACSGEFDSRFYLLRNDDVRRARQNPLRHYMRFGWKEGRDPSANFSTNFYLQNNPDVRQSGTNPLLHYVRFGKKKGVCPKNRRRPSAGKQSPVRQGVLCITRCAAYTFAYR